MTMKITALMTLLLTISTAQAEIITRAVDYDHDGVTLKGWLAYDDAVEGKRPGILVIHEWWGHNEYARKRTEQLAGMGYTALAVDMYGDGKTAGHPKEAGKFSQAAMKNVITAKGRFDAALDVLRKEVSVDPEKTAAIGYCFGGGVALHMARMGSDVKGVVSFHGSLGTKIPAQAGKVTAKILVCHGAADPFVPAEKVAAFKKEMDDANVDYTFKAYAGASHSFTNPGADAMGKKFELPIGYHKAADEQSWADMQSFFDQLFAE